jgi:hemerythrin-like domain-containing protein
MKRHPSLHGLSSDHHLGLVQARRLRRIAGSGSTPDKVEQTLQDFLTHWQNSIRHHFRAEEEVLLPHLARYLSEEDPLILRTIKDHLRLRRLVGELTKALEASSPPLSLAQQIGGELDRHIRFEEEELFQKAQEVIPEEELWEMRPLMDALSPPLLRSKGR